VTKEDPDRVVADAIWKIMQESKHAFWNPKRVISHIAETELFEERISWDTAAQALELIAYIHPDRMDKVTGSKSSYVVRPLPEGFTACRSTQHCAYHGWCHRCAPEFAAIMSAVNRAISDADVPDSYHGPLYSKIGRNLAPHLLSRSSD
jgi:hypothetical protein